MDQRRLKFHKILEEILGSKNVYFQEPSRMQYPCIKYSYANTVTEKANDTTYIRTKEYTVVYIDRKPTNDVVDKLLDLPMSSVGRAWKYDGLNHTSLDIYY